MLYIALPMVDLRDRYQDSEWLLYAKQVHETVFTPQDTLILSSWAVPDRAEWMQTAYQARQQGARVIYVGPKSEETDELKRQLCMMSIYDFAFFVEELTLGVLDDFIEHPRTPADVREYLGQAANVKNSEMPPVVDVIEESPPEKDGEPHTIKNRLRRPLRWGERASSTPTAVVRVVQPKLVAVVGLWPRSGVSTLSYLLSNLLAARLPTGSVGCVEHPRQWPRMWDYFQLDEKLPLNQYRHWMQDGVGQSLEVDGVHLVPLPPGEEESQKDMEPQIIQYLFRQMRRAVTVLDCGQNVQQELLYSMADQIVCVMDCDPTYLSIKELGKKYEGLTEKYGDRMIPVLNKWTRFAQYKDLFDNAVKVPYLEPERVQQALWEGKFIKTTPEEEVHLHTFIQRLVQPFLS